MIMFLLQTFTDNLNAGWNKSLLLKHKHKTKYKGIMKFVLIFSIKQPSIL